MEPLLPSDSPVPTYHFLSSIPSQLFLQTLGGSHYSVLYRKPTFWLPLVGEAVWYLCSEPGLSHWTQCPLIVANSRTLFFFILGKHPTVCTARSGCLLVSSTSPRVPHPLGPSRHARGEADTEHRRNLTCQTTWDINSLVRPSAAGDLVGSIN